MFERRFMVPDKSARNLSFGAIDHEFPGGE